MTLISWTLSILLLAVLAAAGGQQYRYLRARRDIVADRQALFHSSSAFHVATMIALSPDQEVLAGVRTFVDAIERDGATVVYAGKVAVNAMHSSQLPTAEWDAFVLAQYPSREAYAAALTNPDYQKARASFAASYALGMQRSPAQNFALPILLLGRRAVDIIRRQPARYPFQPAEGLDQVPAQMQERRAGLVRGLLANREYGKDAIAVVNFIKNGSSEQRDANSGYGSAMMSVMAEGGHGPIHLGKAVTVEGDADFDQVVIVYYPGVEYFAELVQSEFFTNIVGGKQLADTLSSPTVPLLPHL
ncbi:MAG: hypothetical protein VX466_15200 [Myxococcota bacterium]|nr:hypothetical protein [Myxococcota bacterium]